MSCEHRPSIKYMGPTFQELSQKPHPDTSVDISLVRTVSHGSSASLRSLETHPPTKWASLSEKEG